jgi:hypothetical protein
MDAHPERVVPAFLIDSGQISVVIEIVDHKEIAWRADARKSANGAVCADLCGQEQAAVNIFSPRSP